jgi:putative transposase
VIDCFDGMPVTWTIGTSPDADLVNTARDFRAFKKRDFLQPFLAGDRNKAVYTDFERLFDLVS